MENNPFIKRPLGAASPKPEKLYTKILNTIFPMNMTFLQKFVRTSIMCFFLFFMLYAAGTAILGFGKQMTPAKAEVAIDPLDAAAADHLELLKALRTENQEKAKKEAALKATQENIDLLKVKEAEKKTALDAAVLAPAISPKE